MCNGNPARVAFARILGTVLVAAAFAAAVALTLSRRPRGLRALAAVPWLLGFATLVAAYKGMCVVLHGLHHQHVRPWELFVRQEEDARADADTDAEKAQQSGKNSFGSFGSSNSYEDEPWVVRYHKRNLVRKIFDREVFIREPALRQIQDTIFVQALLLAVLLTGILTAAFVAIPPGRLF